eukprot:2484915-Rhodomonas_salina.1
MVRPCLPVWCTQAVAATQPESASLSVLGAISPQVTVTGQSQHSESGLQSIQLTGNQCVVIMITSSFKLVVQC